MAGSTKLLSCGSGLHGSDYRTWVNGVTLPDMLSVHDDKRPEDGSKARDMTPLLMIIGAAKVVDTACGYGGLMMVDDGPEFVLGSMK